MLRKYEAMFILDQDTQDVKTLSKKMIDIISKDGKIIEQNDLGLIDLAYKINHKKKGNYFVIIVEATAEAIKEFERIANIEKNVVRTLIINTESEQNYEQSIQLSKTDMTKFEEERKARRDFKKPFVKRDDFRPRQPRFEEQEVSHEEAHDFVAKMENKYKQHLAEQNYETEVRTQNQTTSNGERPTAYERAKTDGSHSIDEERFELQKYSNKLRQIATEKDLSKHLQDVNLRDMTKKELIQYMRKVSSSLKK